MALARFAVGAVLSVGFSFAFRVPLRVTNWGALAGRGFFGAVAMTLYYLGIAWTSSGRATLLMNVAPVFILIIGTLFFSEPFHWASLAGLLACMAGAILILYDGTSYPLAGSLACLAGAFFRDFAINFVRRLRTSQHSSYLVYLSACVFGIPFTLHSAGEARTLSWSHAGPLLFVSVIMFGAQIFMGYGYKHTTATTGSLLSYLVIPMVVVLSAVVVDEQITARFLAGAAGHRGRADCRNGVGGLRRRNGCESVIVEDEG
ncbi:MAG: DMT family transporter [Deltaproteobacteria bacterium]|nr:DMT family transporter [Deltaproteobacteria bacterium]